MLRKPGGDREMVDILALVLHHDEQAVLTALELALAEGVPTKTHVLNLLHRLVDGKVVGGPPLDTPQALVLHCEPKANVERYDTLRARRQIEQAVRILSRERGISEEEAYVRIREKSMKSQTPIAEIAAAIIAASGL